MTEASYIKMLLRDSGIESGDWTGLCEWVAKAVDEAFAMGVRVERERCAAAVEAMPVSLCYDSGAQARIAAEIRARSGPAK